MPEYPDISIYVEGLSQRVAGETLTNIRLLNPFVLRSIEPGITDVKGLQVTGVERMGKRIVIVLENNFFIVIHLMIAGRLLWRKPAEASKKPGGKIGLALFEFSSGNLLFTEASTRKRANIHIVRGTEAVEAHRPPGLEVFECSFEQFEAMLKSENRTLKRALTNPSWFSGIGNAYSDEILHAARFSPVRLTQALSQEETQRLFEATKSTLTRWTEILRAQFGGKFPESGQITAFRPDFAAHGKFGKPCPDCGMPIQRIVYAENETNYCARCQNEDRVLADRSLSRLLKEDWPRNIEEVAAS